MRTKVNDAWYIAWNIPSKPVYNSEKINYYVFYSCLRWIICEMKNKIFQYYSLLINPVQLEFLARRQSVFLHFIELAGFVYTRPIFLLMLLTYWNQLLLHNCFKMTTYIHTHISVHGIAFELAYICLSICAYIWQHVRPYLFENNGIYLYMRGWFLGQR